MPRSRGAETPQLQQQRPSPRAPLHLKTTSSDSNGGAHTHHRRSSPKPEGNHRRSPRSPLQEIPVVNQKKRGTKVADLETKLGHAKEELRKLKEQLASAETAKRDAQHELEETKKIMPGAETEAGEQAEEEHGSSSPVTQQSTQEKDDEQEQPTDGLPPVEEGKIQAGSLETPEEGDEEAHVVVEEEEEVAAKEKNVGNKDKEPKDTAPSTPLPEPEATQPVEEGKIQGGSLETPEEGDEEAHVVVEEEEEEMAAKEKNVGNKAKEPKDTAPSTPLPEPEATQMPESEEKKTEMFEEAKPPENAENAGLKKRLSEAEAKAAAALVREEEMALRLSLAGDELEKAKSMAGQLREQLEAAEAAKASLEAEMRKMKVQTEQWRKAAEAAAAVLSGSTEEARVPMAGAERRGSTDECLGGVGFEGPGRGFSGLWSPLAAVEPEDGHGVGRRKGSGGGIRVFGELWKKRGQQQQHHHRI